MQVCNSFYYKWKRYFSLHFLILIYYCSFNWGGIMFSLSTVLVGRVVKAEVENMDQTSMKMWFVNRVTRPGGSHRHHVETTDHAELQIHIVTGTTSTDQYSTYCNRLHVYRPVGSTYCNRLHVYRPVQYILSQAPRWHYRQYYTKYSTVHIVTGATRVYRPVLFVTGTS